MGFVTALKNSYLHRRWAPVVVSLSLSLVAPVALSAANPQRTQAVPTGSQIIAGKSIGSVQLGQDTELVYRALGKPATGDAAMGKVWESWYTSGKPNNRLDIYSVRNFGANAGQKPDHLYVRLVRVTSSWFSAAAAQPGAPRIAVGSSLSAITRSFPAARMVKRYKYDQPNAIGPIFLYDDMKRGIAFEVSRGTKGEASLNNSRCVAVIIHAPGKAIADEASPDLYNPPATAKEAAKDAQEEQ